MMSEQLLNAIKESGVLMEKGVFDLLRVSEPSKAIELLSSLSQKSKLIRNKDITLEHILYLLNYENKGI